MNLNDVKQKLKNNNERKLSKIIEKCVNTPGNPRINLNFTSLRGLKFL